MVTSNFSSPFNPSSPQSRASKKMSVAQTYFLAHKARSKLSSEAGRPDHNLRLLVGHANLLDSLMLDLADAERDEEAWFNQSIKGSSPKTEERHIQWADSIPEAAEEDWEADSSDSDSESDLDEDEDVEMADVISLRRVSANTVVPSSPRMQHVDVSEEDLEEDDEEEDYAALSLTRSPSHSASPPELEHDSDSSDDESMPPSPPFAALPSFSEKQREAITTTVYYASKQDEDDQKADFYNEGYYLPPRNPARLVSAISVY